MCKHLSYILQSIAYRFIEQSKQNFNRKLNDKKQIAFDSDYKGNKRNHYRYLFNQAVNEVHSYISESLEAYVISI